MSHTLWTSAAMACALGLGAAALAAPAPAKAQIGFSVSFNVGYAPPELPDYDQPAMPGDGYIWTPGYWAWDEDEGDYYWAPGTWVLPPREDLLWTPGYWAYDNGRYIFIPGYWDTEVGYYGGIDYGYGYYGRGYDGGQWRNHRFFYNRTVNNFGGAHFDNLYVGPVDRRRGGARASFNGGAGGVNLRPTAQQKTWAGHGHVAPTNDQIQHVRQAATQPGLRASVNHGAPAIAATPRPAAFSGPGVVTHAVAPRAYQRPANAPVQARPMQARPAPQFQRPPPNGVQPYAPENRTMNATPPQPRQDGGRGNGNANGNGNGNGQGGGQGNGHGNGQDNGQRNALPNAQPAPRPTPPQQARPEPTHAAQPAKSEPDKGHDGDHGPDQQH